MPRRYLVSLAAIGLAACATPAPDAPVANRFPVPVAGESDATDSSKAAETTIVAAVNPRNCRMERVTGTRIRKKICMTRAERKHLQTAAQEGMRALKRSESALPRQ